VNDQDATFPCASPTDEIVCTLDELGDVLAPAEIMLFLGEAGALPPPADTLTQIIHAGLLLPLLQDGAEDDEAEGRGALYRMGLE
jgi:hypothetical protein